MIYATPEDIAEGLRLILEKYAKPKSEPSFENEKLIRKKAAKFLGVSYQTMCNWTKYGKIKEHGIGRKRYYLRSELIEVMKNNS